MLQREGFVVADMSASASTPSLLERSSWKAEAIRKGNLKISGPIPITEDMPLNDEEEKQYAEQNAQQNALDQTPQPQDAPTREEPQQPQQLQQETPISPRTVHSPPPAVSEHPSALRANPVVEQPEQEVEAREQRPSRSPPQNMRLVSTSQRQSLAPQSALASPTPFRSTPESTAKANQKKRKSGLRNVFRKMFGKKPAETAQPQEDDSSRRGHSYHHSDPGLLRSTPPPERRESRPPPKAPTPVGPRISDLPVKELEPLHPLGQHLPYPMNVNAPPVSPPNEYLTFDLARTDLGRRRATLPTLPSAAVVRHSLDESRPKLPAWDERVEEGDVSPTGIGIAVSSPGQATSRHNKRRSRSADALHSLAKELASNERRRSDEIKYWRESYMSGSVYSRPETAKTVETFRSVHTQEPTIREPEGRDAFNEMSATLVQADDPQSPTSVAGRQKEEEEEEDPDGHASSVSDFNFGDLKNTVFGPSEAPAPEPEAEREPIAQPQQIPAAAPPLPPQSEKRLSLEDRVSNLESRYSVLETLTRRISANNNRQTIILENPPRNLRSRDRSTSVSASRSHSRSAPSIHQELRRPSTSEAVESGPAPGPATTTSPAHTASSNDEHANALQDMYAALQVERTARIALEQKVQTLQYDISNLHALVNKLIASGSAASPSYPTPSPDMLIMSSEGSDQRMNCSTPRASSHDQSSSFYSQTAQGDRHDWRNDSESIYSDDVPQDDVTSPDEWATPKEEGFAGSGFFHSEGKVRSH